MKKTSVLKKILFVGILTLLLGNFDVYAEEKLITIPEGRTKDTLEVGDEICVNGDTTECFNFIRYDGDNVVMLSKWNLKVGNICDTSWNIIGEYTSSDTGYGLQSSDTRGYVDGASIYKGTVTFSSTKYWDNNKTPKSEYPGAYYPGPNFPMVYDPINYNGSPADGNYSIAYYVENYKNSLVQYGLSVQDARLLTYAEATDASIGCDGSDSVYRCPTDGFITNTSFWLGSAYGYNSIWRVFSSGEFRENFRGRFYIGVRPVIVINKDETDKVIQSSTDNDANNNSQNDANNDEIITDIPNTGFGSNFVVIYLLGFTFIGLGSLVVYNAIEKRKREN